MTRLCSTFLRIPTPTVTSGREQGVVENQERLNERQEYMEFWQPQVAEGLGDPSSWREGHCIELHRGSRPAFCVKD